MKFINASDRELALCYAHIAYRNTVLEDYHSQSVVMDDDFYCTIYKVVSKQIRKIKRNQKKLVHISNLDEYQSMLQQMYPPRAAELNNFALDVCFNITYKMGSDWDSAELIESECPQDAAEYILSGHFKECCKKHRSLNDTTMAYINRDVHNRMYTLVKMKYFGENFEQ